jgi:hypothetical protein
MSAWITFALCFFKTASFASRTNRSERRFGYFRASTEIVEQYRRTNGPIVRCGATYIERPDHVSCNEIFLDLPVHTSCTRGVLTV